jgi:hypothetical protein
MQNATDKAFTSLFKEAFKKCFRTELSAPLSETECKHFSNDILQETGLVIGAKSLKNYSFHVLQPNESKKEKPSVATLDTLARYVLNAPYTDEIKRKERESHYPYWFQYRNSGAVPSSAAETITAPKTFLRNTKLWAAAGIVVLVISIMLLAFHFLSAKKGNNFADNFSSVQEDSLKNKGWFLKSEDRVWWERRGEVPAHLSLFTLSGDNWADSVHAPQIKNLLLRKINSSCFTAEVHLDGFIPVQRWQQAGILLMEDTSFSAKCLRLSFAYNDFFGGYTKPKEIIVQGISSEGNEANHPEEIIHFPLFSIEPGQEALVSSNLKKSALRIEKDGNQYRFLYAAGQAENFAFKEISGKEIDIQPRYIGIFALQGFTNESNYLPARFNYFSLTGKQCKK